MDNQQNNLFRNPQGNMQGAENLQNNGLGQVQQNGVNNNSCQNQGQRGMNCNNIPQNNGAYPFEAQINENSKKKSLTTVIIILLSIAVLVLGTVVAVLLMDGDDEKTKNGGKTTGQMQMGIVGGEASGQTGVVIGGEASEDTDKYNVGDYITFGKYEQDNNESNGKADIEWLVLDKKDGKLLVISKDILSTAMFISNSQYGNNNWAKWDESQIRREMNVEFYNDAFNEDEKKRIAVTKVLPGKNPYYGIDPGGSTEDKLFLLSVDEVLKYFPSESDRKCSMSKYVEECKYSSFAGMWCTRTPGRSNSTAVAVNCNDGSILYEGAYSLNYIGYRPAMWISPGE